MCFGMERRWSFLVTTSSLLLTTCSLLVISISLQTNYMWLAIVVITVILLTTFMYTQQIPVLLIHDLPIRSDSDAGSVTNNNSFVEVEDVIINPPYWITDLPPSYETITSTAPAPPPPYSEVVISKSMEKTEESTQETITTISANVQNNDTHHQPSSNDTVITVSS